MVVISCLIHRGSFEVVLETSGARIRVKSSIDHPHINGLLEQALSERIPGNDVEFRIQRKDGHTRWMTIAWHPICNDV